MRGHPVDHDTDPLLVATVDEVFQFVRRTVARRRRIVADGLVAPRTVERMFGHRHQFDVGEAEVLHIRNEPVREFAVREPAHALFRHTAPGPEMDFVDADRFLERVERAALLHPLAVFPLVAVRVVDDRRSARPQFRLERVRIRLLREEPVVALHLELVEVTRLQLRNEDFPKARAASVLHRMVAAVPAVERADDAHADGVRGPDREVHAFDAVNGHRVRAHFFVGAVVRALAEQVHVKIGDLQREAVRIVHLPDVAVEPGHPQAVPEGLPPVEHDFEESILVRPLHRMRRVVLQHFDLGRVGLEGSDDRVLACRVHAQDAVGRTVGALHDGFDDVVG